MNNSTFSNTVGNLRKRINITPVKNAGDYKKCVSKPGFVSHKIFSKNFLAIHGIKPVLTYDKPIYVKFTILDVSKLLTYESHQKYIRRKFNADLLFTHTDSLVYENKTKDIYEDFYEDKN